MGDFDDFTTYFIFFLLSPYFWVMIIILAFWILFISYLKKKHGEKSKLLLNLLGAIVGILIIGQTGERFKKKSKLKLSKGRTDSTVFMACNDVLSSPKKYITVASVFALCAAFVLVMTNTVTTMKGDGLIDSFSARSEIYFSDQEKQMSFSSSILCFLALMA